MTQSEKTASLPLSTTQGDESNLFFERQKGAFFRRVDWTAFWITFLVSFAVYAYTLAPTVTLEDSGELAVASDYLGVPHPPGYPIWTLLTWFFQWVFNFVQYNGHPNPAWGVGLCSGFFGALACGIVALLVSRSAADMLRGIDRFTASVGTQSESLICLASSVSAGLLFAFSPVLWSQSVIVEVYSLNAFFLMITLLLFYMWMERNHDVKYLWACCFLFGLGLTNHQSLMFLGLGLAIGVLVVDWRLALGFLGVSICLLAMIIINRVLAADGNAEWTWYAGPQHIGFWFWNAYLFIIPVLAIFVLPKGRIIGVSFLLLELGILFYLLMPLASEQNPPINWGYPRTWEGFMHAITRGQYERIDPVENFKQIILNPFMFLRQINAIVLTPRDYCSVVAQFTLPVSLVSLVPLFFIRRISVKTRKWIITSLVSFLSMTLIFIIFQNPKFDVQTLFIMRVQYIQAHAIFALWIGYGLCFGLTYLDAVSRGLKTVLYAGIALILALPLVPILRNAYDDHFIELLGGCEQNGHSFGWQFGNWELQGAQGIEDDFRYWYDAEEFAKAWADYPTPGYPEPMGTNAIFFGGTDPGRFVPTYMIYSAKVREDVYLITQNALADNTYMNVMRDLMGNDIWIPSQRDSNLAFRQYVEDVQNGRVPPGAAISMQDGRVSVQGVQGVMMINGILAKMIFEENKHKHPFYVEESYVIPWMYAYMEPHGLILKMNAEPIPFIPPETVENDTKFWAWYTDFLLNDNGFNRDVVARKTFSKLRSAIAGLYASRQMLSEAENAFRQSIQLYPLSPEANFRLAEMMMQQRRFDDAHNIIESFLKEDPGNDKVGEFLNQIDSVKEMDTKRQLLEKEINTGQIDIMRALELADTYRQLNMQQQFQQLTSQILSQPDLPPQICLQIAQLYQMANRLDLLKNALMVYTSRDPGNFRGWIDLAAVQVGLNDQPGALKSLQQSIQYGGPQAVGVIQTDQRLAAMHANPEFRKLIPVAAMPQQNNPMGMQPMMPQGQGSLPFKGF